MRERSRQPPSKSPPDPVLALSHAPRQRALEIAPEGALIYLNAQLSTETIVATWQMHGARAHGLPTLAPSRRPRHWRRERIRVTRERRATATRATKYRRDTYRLAPHSAAALGRCDARRALERHTRLNAVASPHGTHGRRRCRRAQTPMPRPPCSASLRAAYAENSPPMERPHVCFSIASANCVVDDVRRWKG